MEYQDSHMSRVHAALKRQPKRTVGELAASISGMVKHEVRRALARLRDAGLADREGTPNLWHATEEKPDAPGKAENVNYKTVLTYSEMQPSRSDALDHKEILSRRGDAFVEHSHVRGIVSVPAKKQAPLTTKHASPINSATFCKRDPRQAISRVGA